MFIIRKSMAYLLTNSRVCWGFEKNWFYLNFCATILFMRGFSFKPVGVLDVRIR